jgi:hypothetical protein
VSGRIGIGLEPSQVEDRKILGTQWRGELAFGDGERGREQRLGERFGVDRGLINRGVRGWLAAT